MVKDGQVSNAWSGSKLLINEDIPEIQDFMSKLPTNEQKEKPTQSAKSLSNWSGGSQYSPVERLVPNKENLETSAQTLSASGENDPESIILMTPAKDVVIADKGEEVDFEASGATQLSGTKPSKKLKIEPSS
ncbi:hypothetical protein KIW84_030095 [Lathyrus oleraceus]|uniref:Uncharacterized protein n=1 Tax=Pisum sativum TaxID=3888 RepID=A0A9D4XMG1_PEA|nr:hypothetical protein KIW84_030095 [Pisum sativum]